MTNVPISDDPSGLKSRWEVSVNVGQVLNSTSRTLNVSFVGDSRQFGYLRRYVADSARI